MTLITSLTETKSEEIKKVPVNMVFNMFLDAYVLKHWVCHLLRMFEWTLIRVGKLCSFFYLIVCLLKVKMLALKLLKVNAKIFVFSVCFLWSIVLDSCCPEVPMKCEYIHNMDSMWNAVYCWFSDAYGGSGL